MNKASLLSLVAANLIGSLAAQGAVTAALSNPGEVGVVANRQMDTAPAGPIASGLRLAASDGRMAVATSGAALLDPARAVGARFVSDAMVAAGSNAGTLVDRGRGLMSGAQRYELMLTARASTTGQVVLRFQGQARGAIAGAVVTIGREARTFDAATGAASATIDNLTVDSNGLLVAIEFGGNAGDAAGNAGGYSCLLTASFVEGGGGGGQCTVTPDARSCPLGGTLAGRAAVTGRGVEVGLGLTAALPGAFGFTLLAPQPTVAPLGNARCVFLDTGFLAGIFRTDRAGGATTMLTLPGALGTVYLQTATVSLTPAGLTVATSNTLNVSCR